MDREDFDFVEGAPSLMSGVIPYSDERGGEFFLWSSLPAVLNEYTWLSNFFHFC